MHQSFLNAINPQPRHVCLRIPLRPLTIGHRWLLTELNSPVITGDPAAFGDILLAVLVCAQSHTESERMIRRGWWLSIFAWYWGFRCRHVDLNAEVEKFRLYLEDEQESPPLTPLPKGQSRQIGAPWDWVLYEMLRSVYHCSDEEARSTPIRVANVLWCVRGDSQGNVQLATAQGSVASAIHDLWQRRNQAANTTQN